jgi:SSS family solute:Na+ symporter
MLIGQDIWQRVFTARTDKVASWGGTVAGVYCLVYALAGAVIGMATKALYPQLPGADSAFATIVKSALPTGVRGLVLAAALSAMMSTASGALIASATVANNDIWARVRGRLGRGGAVADGGHDEVGSNRLAIIVLGAVSIGLACLLDDVLSALTVAYNLLVGGLLVPILGGLLWRRGNVQGALAAMIAGGATVIALMITKGTLANEPIYYGLGVSLVAYLAVSLATRPTDEGILATWRDRLAGHTPVEPEPVTAGV